MASDELIHHYTTINSLALILKNKTIRFSRLDKLDDISEAKIGSSRVVTQFLGHMLRGEDINLVDGGKQRRCFTYIDDGIDMLMKIIKNQLT